MATKHETADALSLEAGRLEKRAEQLRSRASAMTVAAWKDGEFQAIPVEHPKWLIEGGYTQERFGDARSANGKYFQWFIQDDRPISTSIEIFCPTFLRGPLSIECYKRDGQVSMGY